VQAQSKQRSLARDHDADVCWPGHGFGLTGALVCCERDGGTVNQAIALVRVDQPPIIGQHASDLIDQRSGNAAARVAMPRRGQTWEQIGVILAEEAERERFVTADHVSAINATVMTALSCRTGAGPCRRHGPCCCSSS
jgi:hypothetical protein